MNNILQNETDGVKENLHDAQTSAADMELINKYSRKELTAEDVYTFSVVLCDNEVDRDNEHFSDEALDKLAQLFVGVTGIYDHTPSAKNQVARIYSCAVEQVDGRKTSYGEPYRRLVARAYIPRCKSSEELIAMLDSGIKKEVSVGCGIGECVCSICGEDLRTGACSHVKGRRYGGKLCCGVLKEPTDAYEWSFIAVPSQREAGVIKSFTYPGDISGILNAQKLLDEEAAESLKTYISSLEKSAREGEMYKSVLRLEAVKAGITARIGIESSLLESMVKGLSAEELLRLKEGFEKTAAELLPVRCQTMTEEAFGTPVRRDDNSGYDI